MGNINLILFICIMTPLAMMLLVFNGRSRAVLGFLMSGIFMCLMAGEINGIILEKTSVTKYFMTINITPIIEECLKAIPIIFISFLFKPQKQLIIEGSVAVGVGFAIQENAYILSGMSDSVSVGWALIRGFGAGMMHGVCTLFVGYAVSIILTRKKFIYTGAFAALSSAIIYHSIYNTVIQSTYSTAGIILPLITYIPLMIIMKRKSIKKFIAKA